MIMEDLSLNHSAAHTDISRLSDAEIPSLSIDEINDDYCEDEFYIKEHTDKLEKLRKENFDLKLKLYLLETEANLSDKKGLKLKIIKEFARRDDELRNMQILLEKRNKENIELCSKLKTYKALKNEHYEQYVKVNNDLQGRVSSAVGIFLKLIDSVEEMLKIVRSNRNDINNSNNTTNIDSLNNKDNRMNEDNFQEKLSDTLKLLEQASKFIIENKEHISDHVDNKKATEKLIYLQEYSRNNMIDISQIDSQEIYAKEFLNIVCVFKKHLEDFRCNQINYRQFSDKMDSLFVQISSQHYIFENLYLDQLDSNKKLKQLQALLLQKDIDRERYDSDLGKCIKHIDEIILKAKDASSHS